MTSFLTNIKKIHGPYLRKDGRRHVVIVYNDQTKRTISYPKFLVEFVLGRALDPHKETIDHIDGDFANNSWDNLRIVPRQKHARDDVTVVSKVLIKCVWCGNLTKKRAKNLNHNARHGKSGPFCTRKCAGQYSKAVQLNKIKPFIPQSAVPIEARQYLKRTKVGGLRISDIIDTSITENDILQYCSNKK